MYLLIDIGNTRIKWQYRDEVGVLESGAVVVEDFMELDFSPLTTVKKILISNVNHKLVLEKVKRSVAHLSCPITEARTETNPYLINDYEDPKALGVDRWLAALGAWRLYQKPLFIINAGTAITVDLVDIDPHQKAHFKGGMILPGVAISLAVLNNSTHLIDSEVGRSLYPSLNTKDAVTTGIFKGIQGAVNLVCKEQPPTLPILLTGGDAQLIYEQADPEWRTRVVLESDLIYEGLLYFK